MSNIWNMFPELLASTWRWTLGPINGVSLAYLPPIHTIKCPNLGSQKLPPDKALGFYWTSSVAEEERLRTPLSPTIR